MPSLGKRLSPLALALVLAFVLAGLVVAYMYDGRLGAFILVFIGVAFLRSKSDARSSNPDDYSADPDPH